jgi:D-glycero-D-manno-heptose 1,7-bisphosphate phosphatase
MKAESLKKVVFLDRDGVINEDSPDYIKSWDEFTFIPRSLEAIRELTSHGFAVFVITNQSIIGRHMVTLEELLRIHERMKESITAADGSIQDIFFCPHTPDDDCDCRKPKPGLIHQARKKYQLDVRHATMVGDNAKDILCAKDAGCRYAILVKTGNSDMAQKALSKKNIACDYLATDLYDAVQWILEAYPSSHVLPSGQAKKQVP